MFNERTDIKNPTATFPSAGRTVVIGKSGYTPRWTHVYQCSDEVKAWDGLDTRVTHCVGSRLGVFIPVIIKVTGRGDRYGIPGIDGPARKIRLTFDAGTPDESTADGWLVGGGDAV